MQGGEIVLPKIPSACILSVARAIAPDAVIQETGLRPTEKLHEILLDEEEASRTYDYGDVYVIAPVHPAWPFTVPADAVKVPTGFRYTSEADPRTVRYTEAVQG